MQDPLADVVRQATGGSSRLALSDMLAGATPTTVFLAVVTLSLIDRSFLNWHDYGLGYWWIDGLRYTVDADSDEEPIFGALLADPWYQHDYASPRGEVPDDYPGPRCHGPYWLDEITPGSYQKRRRRDALESLTEWSSNTKLPPDFSRKYRAEVDDLLPANWAVYELPDLGSDALHDYGDVLGSSGGFIEFIAISPDLRYLNVLVASDD